MTLVLAGDIGGTSTRLAYVWLVAGGLRPVAVKKYSSRDFPGLVEIIRAFVQEHGLPISFAAFGIPGPVRDGHARPTNLPWMIQRSALVRELDNEAVWLLNDLEANAYGIAQLEPGDFATVNTGVADPRGNIAVVSAGTGLGQAGAFWDGARLHPFPSEGGHADFAPRDALEAELLLYLRERDSHVSWERVVSGPGLCSIYEFLRDTGRGVEQDAIRERMQHGDPPAVISEAALAGRCGLCAMALELFVSLYAAEAGNVALKFLATGGVYLGGGIAPRIVEKLTAPEFMRSFARKGRMQELLQAIPVRVVLNEAAALLGAARYAVLRAGLPDPAPLDAGSGPAAG